MTLYEIINQIQLIKNISKTDDEAAHAREDRLYLDFITHVANHSENPKLVKMAKTILTTQKIKFGRWCS